jgi:hypothetical protein
VSWVVNLLKSHFTYERDGQAFHQRDTKLQRSFAPTAALQRPLRPTLGLTVTTVGSTHNSQLAKAAKKHLGPLGMKRKGQSRLWFQDNGWWLGVVEFQPSSWSKGSYLNVAAMWLWNAKDYWSFDEGGRVEKFHEFKDTDQFAHVADTLATRAGDEILALSQRFSSLAVVASHLARNSYEDPWQTYYAAMAALAIGDIEHAQKRFRALLAFKENAPFMVALKAKVQGFSEHLASGTLPSVVVGQEVAQTRALLKLGPFDTAVLWPAARETQHIIPPNLARQAASGR